MFLINALYLNGKIDIPVNSKYNEEYEIMELANKYYQNNLNTNKGIQAKKYLLDRGITDNTINDFQIGLSLDDSDSLTDLLLKKGYNKINLYLGMIEAKKVGLDKVMLDCDVNNLGSDKTLKALGASKKDITRVFNAETIIEGFVAGVFGIVVTLLVNIPINKIVYNMFSVDRIASLPFIGGIVLIGISVILTVVAGLIPARMASKQDAVESLRTE